MKIGKINIYDYIGSEGITASLVSESIESLKAQKVDKIEVHINSSGGSVFEGIAIFNLLKSEKNVEVIIDGIAASIASVIAMAGSKVKMYKNTRMLIHNPWTIAAGDQNDMKKSAEMLETVRQAIIDTYTTKTNLSDEELKSLLDEETMFTAEECVDKKFADEIIEYQNSSKDYVGLFVNVFDDQNNNNKKKENAMNEKLLAFFGLPKDATEEQITNKLNELKAKYNLKEDASFEQVVEAVKNEKKNPPAENNNDDAATKIAALEAKIDALQKNIDGIVAQAIEDGKILPADEKAWKNYLNSNYDAAKAELDAKAKNSAMPGKVEVNNSEKTVKNKSEMIKSAAEFIAGQRK